MGPKSEGDYSKSMKSWKIGEIQWFVDDEGVIPVLHGITEPESGRRGYIKAHYRNGLVFVKSFAEKGLPGFIRNRVASRGKREYELGKRLIGCSILTPVPIGYGISRMGSYIIQEWVDGKSLTAALKESDYDPELMAKLARLLGSLKIHHFRHNDLHLDNVLVYGGQLYLIDLHKMKIKTAFTVADELANLSHALANVYENLDISEREAFFGHYGNPGIREPVERALDRLAARWIRKKKERAFQETSIIVVRGNRLYRIGMENRIQGKLESVIKEDQKVRVERYSDHIRKIYTNRRRLERAWKAHVVLAYMDLPFAPPVFCVELPGEKSTGFIAMEDLREKGEELDRYLDRTYDSMDLRRRRMFIERLARFFLSLARKKIIHKDLKACNVFTLTDGGFMVLDVEDIRFRVLDEEALKRMLIQLNTTIPKRVTAFDRLRFFLHFTSPMKVNKRAIFKAVVKESVKREIVYEGLEGLRRESW